MTSTNRINEILRKTDMSPIYYEAVETDLAQQIEKLLLEARLDELSNIMGGTNTASWIRTPQAGSRSLNLDDVHYYIHNRKRVLSGEKAHTPEEWFDEVR